jgi:electron transfer flavoprotein alpha/beta subunit
MKKSADTKTTSKILYAYIRMVQPNPLILSGHETALDEVPSRGIT